MTFDPKNITVSIYENNLLFQRGFIHPVSKEFSESYLEVCNNGQITLDKVYLTYSLDGRNKELLMACSDIRAGQIVKQTLVKAEGHEAASVTPINIVAVVDGQKYPLQLSDNKENMQDVKAARQVIQLPVELAEGVVLSMFSKSVGNSIAKYFRLENSTNEQVRNISVKWNHGNSTNANCVSRLDDVPAGKEAQEQFTFEDKFYGAAVVLKVKAIIGDKPIEIDVDGFKASRSKRGFSKLLSFVK